MMKRMRKRTCSVFEDHASELGKKISFEYIGQFNHAQLSQNMSKAEDSEARNLILDFMEAHRFVKTK